MRPMLINLVLSSFISQQAFADTCSALSQPMSLTQAMKLAQEHSYTKRMAQSQSDEALARSHQSRGGFGPRVDLEGQKLWFDKSINKLAGQISPNGTLVPDAATTLALQVTQPLTGLKQNFDRYSADSANADASNADLKTAEQEGQLGGARDYINSSKLFELASVARSSVALFEQQMKDMNVIVRTGRGSELDANRIRLALSESKINLAQAETQYQNSLVALKETLGLSNCSEAVQFENQNTDIHIDESQAKERSEITAARHRSEASQYNINRTRSDMWIPNVSFIARYERNFEQETIDARSLVTGLPVYYDKKDVRDNLTYGFTARWTLWDNGTKWSQISEAVSQNQRASLAYEQAVARNLVEKQTSQNELLSMKAVYESSAQTRKFAEDVYRLTNIRFQNGASTTSDLILAERDLTRARAIEVNAHADVIFSSLRFKRALGQL